MELLFNTEIYEKFLLPFVPKTKKYIWIATADIKDLHIQSGRKFLPFLSVLNDLLERGIEIRILHAKEPGPRFRTHFDSFPNFITSKNFNRELCPRQHSKIIIIDNKVAYMGSANLTGAGIGARSKNSRNFESGMLIKDTKMIQKMNREFNKIFLGKYCSDCKLINLCPDPIAHAHE